MSLFPLFSTDLYKQIQMTPTSSVIVLEMKTSKTSQTQKEQSKYNKQFLSLVYRKTFSSAALESWKTTEMIKHNQSISGRSVFMRIETKCDKKREKCNKNNNKTEKRLKSKRAKTKTQQNSWRFVEWRRKSSNYSSAGFTSPHISDLRKFLTRKSAFRKLKKNFSSSIFTSSFMTFVWWGAADGGLGRSSSLWCLEEQPRFCGLQFQGQSSLPHCP